MSTTVFILLSVQLGYYCKQLKYNYMHFSEKSNEFALDIPDFA